VEFDGVGGDAALAMEEIEEGDAGDVHDDRATRGPKTIFGHAEAGFEQAARGFEGAGVMGGAGIGTFGGGDFSDHRGGRIAGIGEKEMKVAVVFFLVADEEGADSEGLKFERSDAGILGQRGGRGLGREPGDGRRTRREIDAGRVGVGESLDGPAFRAAMDATAEAADGQAGLLAQAIEIDAEDDDGDEERNEAISLARIHFRRFTLRVCGFRVNRPTRMRNEAQRVDSRREGSV
jgi:hypothetical protein